MPDPTHPDLVFYSNLNIGDDLVRLIFAEDEKPAWALWPLEMATFESARSLIMCVDGYAAVQRLIHKKTGQDVDALHAATSIAHSMHDTYFETGSWVGSAAELWITAFIMVRAERFTVSGMSFQRPDGSWGTVGKNNPDPTAGNALIRSLRLALLSMQS